MRIRAKNRMKNLIFINMAVYIFLIIDAIDSHVGLPYIILLSTVFLSQASILALMREDKK